VVGLALALAAVREVTWAHDDDDDGDPQRTVSIPLASAGIIYGESMRTTLINRGSHPINLQTSTLDADGTVVKQAPLVLEPGRMRTFEISRSEVARDERSVLLRTEVAVRWGDAKNVWMTSEVVDDSTGSTKSVDRLAANHNETLVLDTRPRCNRRGQRVHQHEAKGQTLKGERS
jgi:hypothetical protein